MVSLSASDSRVLADILDAASILIATLSAEVERDNADINDSLSKTESLLLDVSYLYELFPPANRDELLSAVANFYTWLEEKKFAQRGGQDD